MARIPRATVGIVLQAIGFLVVWSVRVRRPSSIQPDSTSWASLVTGAPVLLATGSLVLVIVSIRYLGRHWSVQPRTIESHVLVTTGPYAVVRHPIYLSMGGFLVAIGLAFAPWWALSVASVLYMVGASIRIKAEDALMAQTFGDAFDAYRRRVPALIPGIRTG